MKISDDCFYGKNISNEQEFLDQTLKKTEQEIQGSEISYFLSKRSMSLCFEMSKMNEKIAKDLLFKIDWLMEAYFFSRKWAERIRMVFEVFT